MDVLQALVLAGSLLRFVTSARDTLSLGLEAITSSTAVEDNHDELEAIVGEISATQHSGRLANSSFFDPGNRPKPHEEALTEICQKCFSLHNDLKNAIKQLQSDVSTEAYETLCATRKFVWKSGENHGLVELNQRLQELEHQIDEHIPPYIRSHKDSIKKWVQELAEISRRLNMNRSEEFKQLVIDTQNAFQNLSDLSSTFEHGDKNAFRGRVGCSSTLRMGKPEDDIILAFSSIARQVRLYAIECHLVRSLASKEQKHYPHGNKRSPPTTETVCSSSAGCLSPDHFNEWLEKGRGMFWISGGSGCGKSTFMRHLSTCAKTQDLLMRWAGNSPVNSSFCFSQNARTTTQYWIDDFLSSIVCKILKQVPGLGAAAFPNKWACLMETRGRDFGEVIFSRDDLIHATKSLSGLKALKAKFFFFIDGLDEYDGFDMKIIPLLKGLCTSSSIKICVTSRLNDTSLHTLGSCHAQHLYLPDFTNLRILQHITQRLNENSWITQRRNSDTYWVDQIYRYLRKESAGNFLWVDLVLAAALTDMNILDGMGDLLAKLKQLPKDLPELLFHILNDVQEDFRNQQARILLIASQAQGPLDVLAFSFLDEVEPDFVLSSVAAPMEQQETESRSRNAKTRILSLCGSLVAILPVENTSMELVVFPYSSVREYLRGTEMRQVLTERLMSPLEPQRAVCSLLLGQIKFHMAGPFWEEGGPIHGFVLQFLHEVRIHAFASNDVLGAHINELEESVYQRKGRTFWWWQKRSVEKGESTSTFLELMIRYKLVGYLRWRFEHFPGRTPGPLEMANLLESTLNPPVGGRLNSEAVKVFLDHGADPNYPSDHGHYLDAKPTPWRLFLLHLVQLVQNKASKDIESDPERFLALEHLINAGVDLETPVHPASNHGPSNSTSRMSVDEVIRITTSREDASYLCRLMEQRRTQNSAKPGWLGWR